MGKLILMSIVIMTFIIPLRHARADEPTRALKRVVVEFCWFSLFYTLLLVYLVPRLA